MLCFTYIKVENKIAFTSGQSSDFHFAKYFGEYEDSGHSGMKKEVSTQLSVLISISEVQIDANSSSEHEFGKNSG